MFNFFRIKSDENLRSLEMPRTLAEVAAGRTVIIEEVKGSDRDVELLMRMGVVPGAAVRMIQTGDPALIDFTGFRMALGHKLLRQIFINPTE